MVTMTLIIIVTTATQNNCIFKYGVISLHSSLQPDVSHMIILDKNIYK
jgi:hypothetical protein